MSIDLESESVKNLINKLTKEGLHLTGSGFLKKHGFINREIYDIDVSCFPSVFDNIDVVCRNIGAAIIEDNFKYEDDFARIKINGFEIDVFKCKEKPNVKNILKAKFNIMLDRVDNFGICQDIFKKHLDDICVIAKYPDSNFDINSVKK